MPLVHSPVKEIKDLHFSEFPSGRVVKIIKSIKIDDVLIMLSENGRIYCPNLGNFAYCFGKYSWTNGLMNGLAKLGVITKKQAETHIKKALEKVKKESISWSAKNALMEIDKVGIKIPPSQRKKLRRLAGKIKS